nr:hypothetical protein [Tanacetum cinerariifolium]
MHNNIMVASLRDRPPMLATGRYAQWKSRFLRYINTRPNGDALRKCILQVLYITSTIIILAEPATDDSLAGESLNIQDVKTNLFLEFGKFTSHDGESMKSYYFRFYKMMNEMIRNNLTVAMIDLEQAQRDKDMQKNLALIQKYFKKIYKPTNNNLRTSSKSKNKNVDTSLRYKNDNHTGQFGNQRTVIVARAKETVDSKIYKPTNNNLRTSSKSKNKNVDTSLRYKNDNHTGQFRNQRTVIVARAKETVDSKQADWLEDTDGKIDEQELEAHYSYMAKIQEVPTANSRANIEPLEKVDSNVIPNSPDMCNNDILTHQNAKECDDERVALANLIANLTLDTKKNKEILKQLKKANTSLTQELKECKSNLAESNTTRDSYLITLQKVYVAQPNGFIDPDHPKKVYRIRKALCGLKQTPRACVGTPMATKPRLDTNLSRKLVDQTDYGSKTRSLVYLTSSRPDLVQADFIFELTAFSVADHARCLDTRKSTSGGIQFLGDKLVSWMSKKHDCIVMSSAEVEYVALSASCAQVIWMRT